MLTLVCLWLGHNSRKHQIYNPRRTVFSKHWFRMLFFWFSAQQMQMFKQHIIKGFVTQRQIEFFSENPSMVIQNLVQLFSFQKLLLGRGIKYKKFKSSKKIQAISDDL